MAPHKARGVCIGCWILVGNMPVFLRVIDKCIKVVTNYFCHTRSRHCDHVWFVCGFTVFQTVFHILLAAEYRRIFCHRIRNTCDRLFKMAIKVGSKIGHTTLTAMNIGHGFFKAQRTENSTQRLASFRRING